MEWNAPKLGHLVAFVGGSFLWVGVDTYSEWWRSVMIDPVLVTWVVGTRGHELMESFLRTALELYCSQGSSHFDTIRWVRSPFINGGTAPRVIPTLVSLVN